MSSHDMEPEASMRNMMLGLTCAEVALASTKQGARIAWMTPAKAAGRFATSFFRKRDILSALEARTNLTVR